MNPDTLEFVIFCIENMAKKLMVEPQRVYTALFEKSDIAMTYIVPNYEVLHSQGKKYILEVLPEEGISI